MYFSGDFFFSHSDHKAGSTDPSVGKCSWFNQFFPDLNKELISYHPFAKFHLKVANYFKRNNSFNLGFLLSRSHSLSYFSLHLFPAAVLSFPTLS